MIYLHIGRHKTGTTSLQEFLSENREALRLQGLSYPVYRKPDIAHHELSIYLKGMGESPELSEFSLFDHSDFAKFKEKFDSEKMSPILSSEGFQNVPPINMRNLTERRELTVVCYLREQVSYAISSYCQRILGSSYSGDFDQFLEGFFRSVDYPRSLEKWANEFGFDSLRLRLYERALMVDKDIRMDFLDLLGVDPNRRASFNLLTKRKTDKVGGDLLKSKIIFNLAGNKQGLRHAQITGLLRSIADEFPHLSKEPDVTRETQEMIEEHYNLSNKSLFDTYNLNANQFTRYEPGLGANILQIDKDFDPRKIVLAEEVLDAISSRNAGVADAFHSAFLQLSVLSP